METVVAGATKRPRTNGRKPQTDAQRLLKYFDISQTSSAAFSEKHFRENGDCQSNDFGSYSYTGFGPIKTTKSVDRFIENSEHGQRPDLKRRSEGIARRIREGVGKIKELSEILPNGGNIGGSSKGSVENKLRKVKIKLGGLTHTLLAKSNTENANDSGVERSSVTLRPQRKITLQDNIDDDNFLPKKSKDNEKPCGKKSRKIHTLPASESEQKSKRVRKSHMLDSSEDEEAEIRYLERLKRTKINVNHCALQGKDSNKLSVYGLRTSSNEEDVDGALTRETRNGKAKSCSDGESDSAEQDFLGSDVDPDSKQKNVGRDSTDGEKEIILTRRQRALRYKDGPGGNEVNLVELSNGLPLTVSRKQKEKPSEVEQLLKKAEAAERRKMQVEKKAMADQAEAIKKILGQDSGRKKREDLMQKKRDELARKRAEDSLTLAPNMVRFVSGPNGTILVFPECVDLLSIFDSKSCSYPPPREKCVGPLCSNAYRYRDSKTNLPLCSLECYRAVQENAQRIC